MTEWELAAQATKAAVLKLLDRKAKAANNPYELAVVNEACRRVKDMPLPVQTGQM